MPYPVAKVGDPVTFVSDDGTTLVPALVTTNADGSANVGLKVEDPNGGFKIVKAGFDASSAGRNTWNWPAGTGAAPGAVKTVTGTSGTTAASDRVVFLTDDATRTLSVTVPPAGAQVVVVDSSGSSTSANTVTVSAASGALHGSGVITPGTNKVLTLVSDGTDLFVASKF